MAVRTRFLHIGIAIVNIAIVALVFTSIWPFPSGEFSVDLPSTSDIVWSYNVATGEIHVTAGYSVNNGWIFDVDDLAVAYNVTNFEHVTLSKATIFVGTLPAGKVTSSEIDFTFNLTRLYQQGAAEMVFRDDSLHFEINVTCCYTMRLIEFEASYQTDVPWDALIRAYGVSAPRWSGGSVAIDYYLQTSPLLSSLNPVPPLSISVYDGNGNLLLAPIHQSVLLGVNYTGTVTFTPTAPSVLPTSFVVHFEFLGYAFVERWP